MTNLLAALAASIERAREDRRGREAQTDGENCRPGLTDTQPGHTSTTVTPPPKRDEP